MDGIYVLRTSVPAPALEASGVISAYKDLAHLERDSRIIKADDLDLRPIYHRFEDRVQAHVLVSILGRYPTRFATDAGRRPGQHVRRHRHHHKSLRQNSWRRRNTAAEGFLASDCGRGNVGMRGRERGYSGAEPEGFGGMRGRHVENLDVGKTNLLEELRHSDVVVEAGTRHTGVGTSDEPDTCLPHALDRIHERSGARPELGQEWRGDGTRQRSTAYAQNTSWIRVHEVDISRDVKPGDFRAGNVWRLKSMRT